MSEWIQRWSRLWEIVVATGREALEYRRVGDDLPERVHRTVLRLGPTFIKLGQIASTRPDLVPEEVSERLRQLQEAVPPFPFDDARAVVEAELGRSLQDAFSAFPREPVASASLSQVYLATLPDGTPVAVKVQRPGIGELIRRDMAILLRLARLAGRLRPSLRALRLDVALGEFGRWTLRELDFEIEASNLDEFRDNFADWDDITFPRVFWSHTTPRVLTMERVAGLRLWEVPEQLGPAFSRELARRLAEMEMKMFISDQFFHADLHPGNIFFQPDGRIAVLDVGMVGRMTADQRDRFLAYWIAITRRQRDRAFQHLLRMAESTAGADLDGFRAAYDRILDRFYGEAELAQRSLAQTYLEVVITGGRFGVVFPAAMILQAKAVVTAEALDLVLAPDFRFADEVRPVVARELAKRAAPSKLLDQAWGGLAEWVLLGEVPAGAPAVGDEAPEEEAFRRAALQALAGEWADAADASLRRAQENVPDRASAAYWRERPETQALVHTALGALRLLASRLARVQERARLERSGSPIPGASDQASRLRTDETLGKELSETLGFLKEGARDLADPDHWEDREESRAAAISGLSILRALVGRVDRAVPEWAANRPMPEPQEEEAQ